MYFLNINKPKGITSFDVIRALRKRLKVKQIGHSGTLDPLASGVMQVAVGKATKLLDYLESDKEYVATLKFGYVSTTFDEEGEKTFVANPCFSYQQFQDTVSKFIGKIKQIPPKYSAIKINGKKACDIVRNNENAQIEIKEREIIINEIEILEFHQNTAKIRVSCQKGTYIRSLADDLGKALECGAYLTDLIRTKAGNFSLKNSNHLEDENFSEISPLDALNFPVLELNDEQFERVVNGNFIHSDNSCSGIILLTKHNKLVSIANLSDNLIKPKKIFKES